MLEYRLIETEYRKSLDPPDTILEEWKGQSEEFGREYLKRPTIHILWLRPWNHFGFEDGVDYGYRLECRSGSTGQWEIVDTLDKNKFNEDVHDWPDDSDPKI